MGIVIRINNDFGTIYSRGSHWLWNMVYWWLHPGMYMTY